MNRIFFFLKNNWIILFAVIFYIITLNFNCFQNKDFISNEILQKNLGYIPLIFFAIAALLALIFNCSSVFFLTIIHFYLYYISVFKPKYFNSAFIFGISILLPINYIFFILSSERGIFNLFGLKKIFAIVAQLYLLTFISIKPNNFIVAAANTKYKILRFYKIFGNLEFRIINILLFFFMIFIVYIFIVKKFRYRAKFFISALLICFFLFQKNYLTNYNQNTNIFIGLFISIIFFALSISVGFEKAYNDELTAIKGRRALNEELNKLNANYSIVMLDIDHFKKFNDTYGHKAGDIVLFSIAQILEKRLSGKVFRYGGEEFTIIYPHKNIKKIYEELDNTRKYISKTKINIGKNNKNQKPKKK
ncbi:MAG TPA: GGDEF domain-containing protein [bacterium]|nr:GGDEF domain-containing protein [bacterium]